MPEDRVLSPAHEAALIRKLDAETLKLEAEQQYSLFKSQIEHMVLGKATLEFESLMNHNHRHRVYTFNGWVTDSSVTAAMQQLDVWRRASTEPVTIVFNSPGGDVMAGLALWDYLQAMKREGIHLTTRAYGYAASMAGILLQAGTTRQIGKESYLMIHEASFGATGKIGEVEDRVEWVKKVQNRVLDIFAERSTRSRRAIKAAWTRKDWWLTSDEALAWGFVDEIL